MPPPAQPLAPSPIIAPSVSIFLCECSHVHAFMTYNNKQHLLASAKEMAQVPMAKHRDRERESRRAAWERWQNDGRQNECVLFTAILALLQITRHKNKNRRARTSVCFCMRVCAFWGVVIANAKCRYYSLTLLITAKDICSLELQDSSMDPLHKLLFCFYLKQPCCQFGFYILLLTYLIYIYLNVRI